MFGWFTIALTTLVWIGWEKTWDPKISCLEEMNQCLSVRLFNSEVFRFFPNFDVGLSSPHFFAENHKRISRNRLQSSASFNIWKKNIKNKNKNSLEGGKVATLFPKGRIWFFGRVECEPCTMIGLFFEVGIHALNLVKTCLNSKQFTNFLGACSPKNLRFFIFYHCVLHCKDVSFLHPHCICMGIVSNNL
jgi:hypothetical protein